MGLLLLIPGLILLIALPGVFAGAATVGLILAIIGGLSTLFQVLWFAFVASRIKRAWDDF